MNNATLAYTAKVRTEEELAIMEVHRIMMHSLNSKRDMPLKIIEDIP